MGCAQYVKYCVEMRLPTGLDLQLGLKDTHDSNIGVRKDVALLSNQVTKPVSFEPALHGAPHRDIVDTDDTEAAAGQDGAQALQP